MRRHISRFRTLPWPEQLKGRQEVARWCTQMWRVYQRGLERWITDLLQPVFDGVVRDGSVPGFVQRLRIVEFTLDHEAPYFSNMRRRYSRKDRCGRAGTPRGATEARVTLRAASAPVPSSPAGAPGLA